ncbi:MAG: class I SAM-dependent methyltransferase [Deltaproteobacteria bacterium]|nr:class I SAM-dependent methyltransferase [Deltaproteobacteria bacterium]
MKRASLVVGLVGLVGAVSLGRAAPPAHEMPHRFRDAARWAKVFEGPERDRWQRPDAVLDALKLKGPLRVADLGAGTGYFAVRLARRLPTGTVLALDLEEDMVRYVRQRAAKEGLKNLTAARSTASDPKLPAEGVDLLFICNTYHHLPARTEYFRRLAPRLRQGGRVVVVDFKLGKLPVGPPEHHRVAPPALERELAAAGYRRLSLDTETLAYQYIAVYALK